MSGDVPLRIKTAYARRGVGQLMNILLLLLLQCNQKKILSIANRKAFRLISICFDFFNSSAQNDNAVKYFKVLWTVCS